MKHRSGCAALALLGVAFVPASAAPVSPSSRPSSAPNPQPSAIVAPQATATPGAGLYGRHARRVAQAYLRLKLLQLRETDLDRAREVIERRLGADALLAPGSLPPPVKPSGTGER